MCLCSCNKCSLKTCPAPMAYHCVSYCSPSAPPPLCPFSVSSLPLALTVSPPASCFPVLKSLVPRTVCTSSPRSARGKEKGQGLTPYPSRSNVGEKVARDSRTLSSAYLSENLCFCQQRQFTYTPNMGPQAVFFTPHTRMSDLSETFPRFSGKFLEFKQ